MQWTTLRRKAEFSWEKRVWGCPERFGVTFWRVPSVTQCTKIVSNVFSWLLRRLFALLAEYHHKNSPPRTTKRLDPKKPLQMEVDRVHANALEAKLTKGEWTLQTWKFVPPLCSHFPSKNPKLSGRRVGLTLCSSKGKRKKKESNRQEEVVQEGSV